MCVVTIVLNWLWRAVCVLEFGVQAVVDWSLSLVGCGFSAGVRVDVSFTALDWPCFFCIVVVLLW